jgi:multisubunit Na+/H+ antiporter MnhE subunit
MHETHPTLPYLFLAAGISCLLPVVFGTVRWKILSRELRIVLALLAFYVAFLVAQVLTSFHGIKNLWMSDLYELLQFVVLAAVFALWTREEKARSVMISSIGIGSVLWLI